MELRREVVIQDKGIEPFRKKAQGDRLPFPLREEGIAAAGDDEQRGAHLFHAQLLHLSVAVRVQVSPFLFAAFGSEIPVQINRFKYHCKILLNFPKVYLSFSAPLR